ELRGAAMQEPASVCLRSSEASIQTCVELRCEALHRSTSDPEKLLFISCVELRSKAMHHSASDAEKLPFMSCVELQ
ncbi:hypothetical protein NDU88_000126, partial [Pleurodeles waltl]